MKLRVKFTTSGVCKHNYNITSLKTFYAKSCKIFCSISFLLGFFLRAICFGFCFNVDLSCNLPCLLSSSLSSDWNCLKFVSSSKSQKLPLWSSLNWLTSKRLKKECQYIIKTYAEKWHRLSSNFLELNGTIKE